jgi:hypothetical protein
VGFAIGLINELVAATAVRTLLRSSPSGDTVPDRCGEPEADDVIDLHWPW